MVVRPPSTFVYRFGVFELDLRAAELRKNGVRLKLQDQPYQVLLKLLEHPGEIVSREELRATRWHEDTFVDFETGLNTAIKRLRETIGDSADHPTFIETVPRRGCKFIAPVGGTVGKDQSNETPDLTNRQESSQGKGLRNRGWVAAAVALLLLASVAIGYRQPRPPTVTNTVRITNDLQAKSPLNPFVTDGLHLYFIEGTPWTTGSRIAQLSATGEKQPGFPQPFRKFWPSLASPQMARSYWSQTTSAAAPILHRNFGCSHYRRGRRTAWET
jgi:DNA-binding winged helix-turn-helix (wHTH) protein